MEQQLCMTHAEKIKYLNIATGICHFGFTPLQLDLLVSLYDLINVRQGDTDVKSICEVQAIVEERHKPKQDKPKQDGPNNA